MTKKKVGRPLKITEAVLNKLEEGFTLGLTDELACLYADVGERTFYDYTKKHPKFSQRKEALKHTPKLNAKAIIAKNLQDWSKDHTKAFKDVMEYLKATDKDFNPKTITEITGAGGGSVKVEHTNIDLKGALKAYNEQKESK